MLWLADVKKKKKACKSLLCTKTVEENCSVHEIRNVCGSLVIDLKSIYPIFTSFTNHILHSYFLTFK